MRQGTTVVQAVLETNAQACLLQGKPAAGGGGANKEHMKQIGKQPSKPAHCFVHYR